MCSLCKIIFPTLYSKNNGRILLSPSFSVKLAVWNFTEYKKKVFTDNDAIIPLLYVLF